MSGYIEWLRSEMGKDCSARTRWVGEDIPTDHLLYQLHPGFGPRKLTNLDIVARHLGRFASLTAVKYFKS